MTITKDPSTTTSHQPQHHPLDPETTGRSDKQSPNRAGIPMPRVARLDDGSECERPRPKGLKAHGSYVPRTFTDAALGARATASARVGPRRQSRVPARWDHAGEDPVAAVAGAADRLSARRRIGRLPAGLVPRIRGHGCPPGLPSRRAGDRRRMGGSCATRCSESTAAPASESGSRWNATDTPASTRRPTSRSSQEACARAKSRPRTCGAGAIYAPNCGR